MISPAEAVPIIQRMQAEIQDLRHHLKMRQHLHPSHRSHPMPGELPQGARPQFDPWNSDFPTFNPVPEEGRAHIYRVEDGAIHWYLGESREDALARHSLHLSTLEGLGHPEDMETEFGPFKVVRLPEDEMISVILDPTIPDSPEESHTCEEWILLARSGTARVNRYGLLSTTNF